MSKGLNLFLSVMVQLLIRFTLLYTLKVDKTKKDVQCGGGKKKKPSKDGSRPDGQNRVFTI